MNCSIPCLLYLQFHTIHKPGKENIKTITLDHRLELDSKLTEANMSSNEL